MWLIICLIFFMASLVAADLVGDDFTTSGFAPEDGSMSAYFLIGAIVSFGIWVVLSMFIKDDGVDEDDLR